MRVIAVLTLLILTGCASGTSLQLPHLMGPADSTTCTTTRKDGNVGTYECTIKGRYVMEDAGIF